MATPSTVAHYCITAELGRGGMGEVYRATDTKLNREVAIKILPEAFAQDAERMARFRREAQVLASLNHPNIAAIYGVEERALVMELVEGPTLADRIAQDPIPLEEALPIARQMAEALEAAHEKGIVHRDLKPANIKLTAEGKVKVLDFGLASVAQPPVSGDPRSSPTLTISPTQTGMILGTAAYMSPEQARGKTVDRRADIWAFGCVLYEMLVGQQAFTGETVADVMAAVVREEPDWTKLPASLPAGIQKLLRRCLHKNPKQRLQAIGDARIAIEETLSGAEAAAPLGPLPVGQERREARSGGWLAALRWAAIAVLLGLAVLGGWWFGTRSIVPSAEWSGELLPGPTIAFWPRVSPDGRLLAFQAMADIMAQVAVMDPGSGNWTVLTEDRTSGLVASLCWSRDGSKIYFDRFFSQPLGVFSVPSLGGEERLVLANAANPESLPDGSLLLVRIDPDRKSQVYHFWPDSGRLEALGAWVTLSPAAPLRVFPDGKEMVFFGTAKGKGADDSPHLYRQDIDTGRAERLAPELPIVQLAQLFPLAVTPDGQSVLIDLPSGNLHRIVAIPRSGRGSIRTLITLTSAPWALDAAPDGALYVDQVDRPLDVLRLPRSGGTPEVLASLESYSQEFAPPVEFSDGRIVLPTLISGRPRLLVGKPGGSFVPLLETNEDTAPPMVQVGDDEAALMVGSSPQRSLAIVSVKEGRILRRFDVTVGKQITGLAASPDGKDLYYLSSGSVWSVPSQGGSPHMICAGDGAAVNPDGRDLIVSLNEQQHVRLERVPLTGGPTQPIQVRGDLPVSPMLLGPDALNKDGKLLVSVAPRDSWFFGLAILDPTTGAVTRVPLNYTGDIMVAGWGSDGRILAIANPMRSHIWRFRHIQR
jgi:predicted Ser/Thr protein kinase